jgi:hypothetical protein
MRFVMLDEVGCLRLDLLARVFIAGGAACLALAAVLARVFMAGACTGLGGAVGGARRFLRAAAGMGKRGGVVGWFGWGSCLGSSSCFAKALVIR